MSQKISDFKYFTLCISCCQSYKQENMIRFPLSFDGYTNLTRRGAFVNIIPLPFLEILYTFRTDTFLCLYVFCVYKYDGISDSGIRGPGVL